MWVKSQDQAKESRSHQRSSHFSAQNYAAGSDISWKWSLPNTIFNGKLYATSSVQKERPRQTLS